MMYSLIDPKIKKFILFSLKECHEFKENNINIIFNILMFLLFILITWLLLSYKYKGKLNDSEIKERNLKNLNYITSKIRSISLEKQKQSNQIITNLPSFEKY